MIWKWKARDLVVEIFGIVPILKARAEVEDAELGAIASCKKALDVCTVVSIEGLDARGWQSAGTGVSAGLVLGQAAC